MHTKPPTPAVFQILLALVEGERHGYAIMQAVAAETENVFTMGPGTLYGALKRMLAAGLVEESGERPDPEMMLSDSVVPSVAGIPGLALLSAFVVALGLVGSYSGALVRRFAMMALGD